MKLPVSSLFILSYNWWHSRVGTTSPCHGEGHGFESRCHRKCTCGAIGSAGVSKTQGCLFESSQVCMFLNYCKIGQLLHCRQKGCEFKRVINQHCPSSVQFRPPEDVKHFYSKKPKKKKVAKPVQPLKQDDEKLIERICTPKQDDWITKIKTI